jgi:hypothetical protein
LLFTNLTTSAFFLLGHSACNSFWFSRTHLHFALDQRFFSLFKLIPPISLCLKFSVFQLACRQQLARNMYSIQYSTYQIQILSPTIQMCLTLLKRTLMPHSCIITHYYQIQSCCLCFYTVSE